MRKFYVGPIKTTSLLEFQDFCFVAFVNGDDRIEIVKNRFDGRLGFFDKQFVALYIIKIMEIYFKGLTN
jgi:hypothetical protein